MSSKSNSVVILAAGRGERFVGSAWSVPKPLIEFRGLSLIRHSIHVALALRQGEGRVVVVTTPVVAGTLSSRYGIDHVVPVTVTQRGPAHSGLLAMAHLDPEMPVTFMDCDNYYDVNDRSWCAEIPVGSAFITTAKVPAGLERTDFCNVRTHGDVVFDVAEKRALGGDSRVATGVYGFESARTFQAAVFQASPLYEKEIPMSDVLYRSTSSLIDVHVAGWTPVGTPSQMERAYGKS